MTRARRTLLRLLRGTSDQNVRFGDLCGLLDALGFAGRLRGSHHIYTRQNIVEIINLQPREGGFAKPYQVRQVRDIILKYRLTEEITE